MVIILAFLNRSIQGFSYYITMCFRAVFNCEILRDMKMAAGIDNIQKNNTVRLMNEAGFVLNTDTVSKQLKEKIADQQTLITCS